MTTSIIPYEELKGSVAKYGGTLADAVNRKVARLFRNASIDIPAGDPKAERKLAVRKAAQKTLADYLDEQQALFASKGLDKHRAFKEAIIPTGETIKTPRGEVEVFHIVPRNHDIEPVQFAPGVSVSVRLTESPVSMVKEERRGKYNDGHMLINIEASSIDRSEYKSMNSLI